jgi:hypothetical protein
MEKKKSRRGIPQRRQIPMQMIINNGAFPLTRNVGFCNTRTLPFIHKDRQRAAQTTIPN